MIRVMRMHGGVLHGFWMSEYGMHDTQAFERVTHHECSSNTGRINIKYEDHNM